MQKRVLRAFTVLCLCAATVVMLVGCGSTGSSGDGILEYNEDGSVRAKELTVIKIGTHAVSEIDPTWVNEVTGEPAMSADSIRAANIALEKVREKLNVEVQFLNYSSDLQQLLLQTVLAGDPYCHIAILWNGCQGNILKQNIVRPIDDFVDEVFFDDPDGSWCPTNPIYGHYYLLNRDFLFVNSWPLCYNIDYIEAVPALKEDDGTAMYPGEMWYRGTWTWNNFEDYMKKVLAYYNGKPSPLRPATPIKPMQTEYGYTALQCVHSAGSSCFDGTNIGIDSDAAIDAMTWFKKMFDEDLIMTVRSSATSTGGNWQWASDDFMNGETVFTNCMRWRMDDASYGLASRGQSMGIVPFPKPDGQNAKYAKDYEQVVASADSAALLRGFSDEESRLALETWKTYKAEYYKALARVDSMAEYVEERAPAEAMEYGVDIFHEEIGDINLQIFKEQIFVDGEMLHTNDFAESLGIQGTWAGRIFGEMVYGLNGSPEDYATAVREKKVLVTERLDELKEALSGSAELKDMILPGVYRADTSEPIKFPKGTDPETIKWESMFTADDNLDGELDIATAKIDYSAIDFDTAGIYADGVVVSINDSAGNTGTGKFEVYIYDTDITQPPTLIIKEDYPTIQLEADTSTFDWKGKFIEKAEDANGLDVSTNLKVDVRELDVTTEGTYDVTFVVSDFTGNTSEVTVPVTIVK